MLASCDEDTGDDAECVMEQPVHPCAEAAAWQFSAPMQGYAALVLFGSSDASDLLPEHPIGGESITWTNEDRDACMAIVAADAGACVLSYDPAVDEDVRDACRKAIALTPDTEGGFCASLACVVAGECD